MSLTSLGDFLALLEGSGELLRIAAPVDPALEIAEITCRMTRGEAGGPALFFESVRGSKIPVVTNLLGNRSRLCRAFGVKSLDELSERLTAPAADETPSRWLEALKLAPSLSPLAPRVVKSAYCQQIVKLGRDVNLWDLPILRSWPDEPQPVITMGQVFTRCPRTQERSIELVPVQVLDQQRLAPCWHRHHAGLRHWQAALAANQQLPIAVVLGGHPASALAALATLPPATDPLTFSSLMQGGKLELVKCRSSDLEVFASAEIVLEGILDPTTPPQPAAPFALPTGFYSIRCESLPVVQVTAVTHRANPVYPAQVFAAPPNEESWMRSALERVFLPWIKRAIPELVDYHSPAAGGSRNWLFVSIRKDYPLAAHKVMHALWGHASTMFSKGIVVVDADVDVHKADDVWFNVGAHVDPQRDLVIASGPTDIDDHASPVTGTGHKLGIDATRKLPEEINGRPWPKSLAMPDAVRRQVTERWQELKLPPREEQR